MAYTLIEACEPFAVFDDVTCDCEAIGQEGVEEILAQATDALVAMTGFQYRGQCVETFRPRGPSGCSCMCNAAADCRCSDLQGSCEQAECQRSNKAHDSNTTRESMRANLRPTMLKCIVV